MHEEGDSPSATEVVQSTSLDEETAPKTDNKKSVLKRVGSMIGGKRSKDKAATESTEDLVAQLTKERDRYKNAHLTSEAEKKELITKMEYEAKLHSAAIKLKDMEIENLKIAHLQSEAEKDWEIKLKSAEIEYLQKMGVEWKSRISQLEKAMGTNKENLKICGGITHGVENVEKNLRSLLDRPTETTIRWRFTEISELTANGASSQPTEFSGFSWIIQVTKMNGYLGIFLQAKQFGAAKWSCPVIADLHLLSQENDSIVKHHEFQIRVVYDEVKYSWGKRELIPFEDLLKGDAVKDDSIIVAVVVKVFPSN